MNKYSLLFTLVVPCCLQASVAIQVPASLPKVEALELYKKYLKQDGAKAFAISDAGLYGAGWGFSSLKRAKQKALEYCQQTQANKPCKFVDLDGEVLGETIDANVLKQRLSLAKSKKWPKGDNTKLPYELLPSQSQIRGFKDYLTKVGYRAFSSAADGAWGYSFGNSTEMQARSNALKNCQKHAKTKKACLIRHFNNTKVSYHVAENWTLPEATKLQSPGSFTQDWHGRYQLGFSDEPPATSMISKMELVIGSKGFMLKSRRNFLASGKYQYKGQQLVLLPEVGQLNGVRFEYTGTNLVSSALEGITFYKLKR